MNTESIAITVIVAIITMALGYFVSRAKSAKAQASHQHRLEQQQNQVNTLRGELEDTRIRLNHTEESLHGNQTQLAVSNNDLQSAKIRSQELIQELAEARSQSESRQAELSEVKQSLSQANTSLDAERMRVADLVEQLTLSRADMSAQRKKTEEVEAERNRINESLASSQGKLEAEQKRSGGLSEQIAQLTTDLKHQRDMTATVETERNDLNKRLATIEASREKEQKHYQEQLSLLQENKEALTQEFKNLANEIMEAKGKAFTEQNKASLDAMLNPFRHQINEFKGKVEHLHLEGTKQQTEMRTELKQLQAMHAEMTQEAHNLSTALQGQKKVQGNWGELVLENVLDRSGLRIGIDYKREDSFQNEEGGRGRPDAVIYLPQKKHLIIDAKVSLNAYTNYVNAEDEVTRQHELKKHVKAFAERIKELADRDYYKLKGLNSPEMVFMFVPIESAFVEALKADETLFQKAIEQNVLVATPTTLLTSLNIVRQLWRYEDQNKHTAELAKKAEGVFKKLKAFLTSFDGIRKGLEKAQESYAKAEGQLVQGPGNLVKQVSDFKQLAPAIKDQLPDYFAEKAELELDYQPGRNEGKSDESFVTHESFQVEKEIA